MLRVKICGITNIEDATAAWEAGADAIGFVFAEAGKKRNRYMTPEAALEIIEALPPYLTTVGVCVDAPVEDLRRCLEIVDIVQLHGSEPPEVAAALHPRVMKVFRVGPDFSVERLNDYACPACMLDAYVPEDPGGTGETFDWSTARDAVETGKPIVLAGGLTPDNVAEAVRTVRPHAVDVSSGVESAPGKKDYERLRRFIDTAKASLA